MTSTPARTVSHSHREKILLVNGLRTRGGEERTVLDLLRGLVARGFEVAVACDASGVMVREAMDSGADVLHLDLKSKWSVHAAWQLRRQIHLWNPDLVHAHGSYPGLHARLSLLGGETVPLIWTSQLHPLWSEPRGGASWLGRACYAAVLRGLDHLTAETVYVSQGLAEETIRFMGRAPSRWSVVHNAVDVDRYRPSRERRDSFRQDLSLDPETVVIGLLARLTPRKGIDTFVRAMASLKHRTAVGVIAGDGPERATYEELAAEIGVSDRLRFVGELESSESFVAGIDVGVLPSRGEGLPLCVMEMLSAGVPVVLSDIPMHEPFRVASSAVAFAPTEDAGMFARAIDLMLHRASSEHLRQIARQAAVEHFSLAAMVRGYVEVYRRVLALENRGGHSEDRARELEIRGAG